MSAHSSQEDDTLESRNEPYASMESVLFELANSERLSILFGLRNEKSNLSKLSKDLNIVVQEVHRHINRLLESNLVKKESTSLYSLTTLGETMLSQLSSLNFISNNKDYFKEHSLSNIPLKFVHRIGALVGCKYLDNPVSILEYQNEIFRETTDAIYAILPIVPSHIIESIIPIISKNIKLNYILPYSAPVPKSRHGKWHSEFSKFLNKGTIQRRMAEELQLAMVMNEKNAIVMFPLLKGQVDTNCGFAEGGSVFHEWCMDYFDYVWHKAKPYSTKKLSEV